MYPSFKKLFHGNHCHNHSPPLGFLPPVISSSTRTRLSTPAQNPEPCVFNTIKKYITSFNNLQYFQIKNLPLISPAVF
jgi:hypothetical protein